jgi:predicted RNA binding protein YcfA (HicA-like mRNA interferase family)
MTYAELIRRLRPFGIEFRRHARGSHEIWSLRSAGRYAVIPNHAGREIAPRTLARILRDLELTLEELQSGPHRQE